MHTDRQRQVLNRPVSILIPAYGAASSLRNCLLSLVEFAPRDCTIHVLDDATPDDSIRETCAEIQNSLPQLRYARSEMNRGFVGVCNWGCETFRDPSADLLLLNSDTEATAGFLEELQEVLYLHEKHGVVSPRSNNATIFSIPHPAWSQVKGLLPRYRIMPTAVGFCMLIKAEVLNRFAFFDEIYSPGYNEENDFVCRINRYGYSALAANWAYVFHHESSSFGSRRAKLEEAHSQILLFRYPEYERKVADYERFHKDPVERFATLLTPHRPRILYDLFHLPPAYTGTSDFGLNLLRELSRIVEDEFELSVGVHPEVRFFAHELTGYRLFEDPPDSPALFDLVFKPCQIFSWIEFVRMDRLAPRLAFCLQDIIGVRCDYFNSPRRQIVLQRTAELSDRVFTISEFSRSDFNAFYGLDIPMQVIHHGTNFGMAAGEFRAGEYVLLMGNDYVHKGIRDALEHLGDDWPTVVLGGKQESTHANVRRLGSGKLTRQQLRELFSDARVVVYPSHYEGFGLPIIDALALGKPVVALDSAVNRELASTLADPNLYCVSSMQELRSVVAKLFDKEPAMPATEPRRWRDVAQDYAPAFREMLSRDVDPARIRARWELLRTLDSAALPEEIS
jgi:GT2 family glycosyltransferase/glycosyltransferase involved in cell wall biosynthesis